MRCGEEVAQKLQPVVSLKRLVAGFEANLRQGSGLGDRNHPFFSSENLHSREQLHQKASAVKMVGAGGPSDTVGGRTRGVKTKVVV